MRPMKLLPIRLLPSGPSIHSLQTMCCLSKTQPDFFCSSVGDGCWLFNNQSSFALLPKSSPSSLLLFFLLLPPPPSPLCSRNIVGKDSLFRNDHSVNSWVVHQVIQSYKSREDCKRIGQDLWVLDQVHSSQSPRCFWKSHFSSKKSQERIFQGGFNNLAKALHTSWWAKFLKWQPLSVYSRICLLVWSKWQGT